MLFKKISIGILGLTSMLLVTCSQAYAAKMIVAVDPSLATAMEDLTSTFLAYYRNANPSYDSALMVGPSAGFRDDIINTGSSVPYDLFISANPDPSDLYYKYQFSNPSVTVSKPFKFATDSVILYSGWMNAMDISTGFPNPLNQDFMMADPVTDAYGTVSAALLSEVPTFGSVLGQVKIAPDVGSAFAGVEYLTPANGGAAFGFVAKSSVCRNYNGTEIYEAGSYHYEFRHDDDSQSLNSIKLTGVIILRERTKEEKAELDAFVDFLMGRGKYTAAATLKEYCYVPMASNK